MLGDGPQVSVVTDKQLNCEGQNIAVRVYHPAPDKKLPVLLHFHGGGHMCGSIDLYDPVSRRLAIACQCIVICVEYRLAREHPYPAGINDCQQALLHYQQALVDMNYGEQIYIVGDSAGGAICTTLTMNSVTNEALKIDKQILIYPGVDYTMSFASMDENGQGFLLEKDKVQYYFQQYFQTQNLTEERVKKASPLFADFTANMPDTLVFSGGCDPLKDEAFAYVNALENVGVKVEHQHFDGMVHAYMLLHSLVVEECEQTYQSIANFINNRPTA
ncbi:alpha/beta hydrolase [Thalassotalea sp. ND16A]|uniref:alpha/beta hydrolase n=1 Tax=Thalassotalea sp. ND16A TaxID=1535422 RepID=UPI00051DB93D|nr:alpha/beta hydrolase [Thalassotalea sp. ND16A]KGJ98086.1 hypothetical protein ND16A_0891 [Thalassotalea sp. ND16A]